MDGRTKRKLWRNEFLIMQSSCEEIFRQVRELRLEKAENLKFAGSDREMSPFCLAGSRVYDVSQEYNCLMGLGVIGDLPY